jgi:hypothetical protein
MKKAASIIVSLSLFACTHGEKKKDNYTKASSFELKQEDKGQSYSLSGALSPVPDEASVELTHVAPGGKFIGIYEETQVRSPNRGVVGTFKIYDISENIVLFDKSVVHVSKADDIDFESASVKAQKDLETLAEKRIKETGLLKLESNPRFTEANVELIKKYDGYYSTDGSSRRDSIFWNDRTYEFEIGNPKTPVMNTSANCKNYNNPDYQLTINGKTVFNDGRQPSAASCPSTLALHQIYSIRGHLLFILKNQSSTVSMHEQKSYTIPVWDMSKIAPKKE